MVDVVDKATRSRMMSGIKGKNTKPEITVRKALFLSGYRFRLHRKDLPGNPDIVLPGRKVAIFVHGCFWHSHEGCSLSKIPATNTEFWKNKLSENVRRDHRAKEGLVRKGWRVLTVWECFVRSADSLEILAAKLKGWIESESVTGTLERIDPDRVSIPSGKTS